MSRQGDYAAIGYSLDTVPSSFEAFESLAEAAGQNSGFTYEKDASGPGLPGPVFFSGGLSQRPVARPRSSDLSHGSALHLTMLGGLGILSGLR